MMRVASWSIIEPMFNPTVIVHVIVGKRKLPFTLGVSVNTAITLGIVVSLKTIKTNRVAPKWGFNPFLSNSIDFNETNIAGVITALTLTLCHHRPVKKSSFTVHTLAPKSESGLPGNMAAGLLGELAAFVTCCCGGWAGDGAARLVDPIVKPESPEPGEKLEPETRRPHRDINTWWNLHVIYSSTTRYVVVGRAKLVHWSYYKRHDRDFPLKLARLFLGLIYTWPSPISILNVFTCWKCIGLGVCLGLMARSQTWRQVWLRIPLPGDFSQIDLWLQLYNAESSHWTKTGTDTCP